MHDSKTGVHMGGTDYIMIADNIIDTVTMGVQAADGCQSVTIIHNTIYSGSGKGAGSIGIDAGTTCPFWTVFQNIITDFENGVVFDDTSSSTGVWDYNNYFDNTTDRTSVPIGNNDIDTDPAFAAAATGNFDIGVAMDDLGLDHQGDSSTSHMEMGACMYEETAGGSSGGVGGGWIIQ